MPRAPTASLLRPTASPTACAGLPLPTAGVPSQVRGHAASPHQGRACPGRAARGRAAPPLPSVPTSAGPATEAVLLHLYLAEDDDTSACVQSTSLMRCTSLTSWMSCSRPCCSTSTSPRLTRTPPGSQPFPCRQGLPCHQAYYFPLHAAAASQPPTSLCCCCCWPASSPPPLLLSRPCHA